MFINTRKIAQDTVSRALSNQFYTMMSRFDVTSPRYDDFRVYGRVTTHDGERVVMIQNISFPKKLQGKGLFNAICQAFRQHPETKGCKIYIQCVQNPTWLEHLRNSPDWTETYTNDFISTK